VCVLATTISRPTFELTSLDILACRKEFDVDSLEPTVTPPAKEEKTEDKSATSPASDAEVEHQVDVNDQPDQVDIDDQPAELVEEVSLEDVEESEMVAATELQNVRLFTKPNSLPPLATTRHELTTNYDT
jgi:hypothetical protein